MTRPADRIATSLPVAAILMAMIVVGCATAGPPVVEAPGASPSVGAGPGSQALVAHDLAFDRSELLVPAGQAFSLAFENRDSAPHNVSITDAAGVTRFAGEIFSGPDTRRYDVPALEAGTYSFRCDVHTSMTGTLVAGAPGTVD